jgi:hypothetical protein
MRSVKAEAAALTLPFYKEQGVLFCLSVQIGNSIIWTHDGMGNLKKKVV